MHLHFGSLSILAQNVKQRCQCLSVNQRKEEGSRYAEKITDIDCNLYLSNHVQS